jgi:hypothetical protein
LLDQGLARVHTTNAYHVHSANVKFPGAGPKGKFSERSGQLPE